MLNSNLASTALPENDCWPPTRKARGMTQQSPESVIRFGVDIGGTGIKGAPVDLSTGLLTADRMRIPTPQPATPAAIGAVVAQVVSPFGWDGPHGGALPAALQAGGGPD